jgi:hypothetical protein
LLFVNVKRLTSDTAPYGETSVIHNIDITSPLSVLFHLSTTNPSLASILAMKLSSLVLLASTALVATAAEVKIEIVHVETCTRKTQAGDTISVNYRGTLPGGEQFDSSYDRGQPIEFRLAKGDVIKGCVYVFFNCVS